MAFSLFGKKDEPEKKDDPAKKPAASRPGGGASIPPRAGVTPAPKPIAGNQGAANTRPGGPPSVQPRAPARPAPPPDDAPDLDFGDLIEEPKPERRSRDREDSGRSGPPAKKSKEDEASAHLPATYAPKVDLPEPPGGMPFDMGALAMDLGFAAPAGQKPEAKAAPPAPARPAAAQTAPQAAPQAPRQAPPVAAPKAPPPQAAPAQAPAKPAAPAPQAAAPTQQPAQPAPARAAAPQAPASQAAAPQAAPVKAPQPAPQPAPQAAPTAPPSAAAPASGGLQIEKTWQPQGHTLPTDKSGAKPPVKPGPVEPARPRASASAGPSAPPVLNAAAPKPAAAPAAAASVAPVAAAPAAPVAASAPKPQPAPAAAPAPVAAAAPAAAKAEEAERALPDALQQAAVMFANGQSDPAIKALKAAIAGGALGDFAAQAWLMLFDLYQVTGRKEEHDELALEFVVKFERSAPAWRDEPKEAQDAAGQRGMGSYFALTGNLSAASATEFEQLQKVANNGALLRLEFSKLKDVDADGAKLLLDNLKALVKARRELVLSNHANLVNLLSSHLEVGNKDNPQVLWMLLLELYQILGLQAEYDDTALNYAITYEVSPPSFEALAKPAKAEAAAVADVPAGDDDAIALAGEVTGSDDQELARLATSAALRPHVVVDMSRVKRVDFVAAGAILNTVTALTGAKKTVEFRATNELVSALFQVVGITRHAQLVRRR